MLFQGVRCLFRDANNVIVPADIADRIAVDNDGKVIRLIFPELNEERRKELTKVARKSAEEAKVAVRAIRRDAIEQIKKMKKDSAITEDDQRKGEEEMQKITDNAVKEIDKICAAKEKEIMEI